MRESITENRKEVKSIINKIKQRDLSGNEGTAIKNSSWQLATTLTAKTGSIFFTIIVARLMLPEIYGLYGLAISTILFIGGFSDFGIPSALITFLSKNIDKNPEKAKGYFYFLTKYQVFLTLTAAVVLGLLASWFAHSYYNKPIFYALLAGTLYLPVMFFSSYLNSLFISRNDFRPMFAREIIVQVSKLVIIPFSIIYFLSKLPSIETYLFWIIILLTFCNLMGGLYALINLKRKHPFNRSKADQLTSKEKKELARFILPLIVTVFSGVFFGVIDQIMLGHYVASEYIGYYQAAFNLAISASTILTFSTNAAFPIFARLKGKKLERGFKKIRVIIFLISILAAIFTFSIAPYIIRIIYGAEYITAVNYLRIFSLILISFPLVGLYATYYISQKRTKVVSIMLIISTIINVILNYTFINFGLNYSMFHAVLGACIATIISRYINLAALILWRRRS